ncbi:MAG: hypothetical protein QGH23_04420 [Dehalococcoidia bacterium]|jgi:hypothetical protein|nr:hypothetical protein [Dehalococcoidia bacterium]MDP6782560.1 hypothetical protein [Dehalococcoidia bacterium]|tara:strand:+ start:301 stop:825 length:525 start_codon:yes stop_codon:yes gene_type:complete
MARRLAERRVGVAALLSDGFYLYYWFYISWQFLKEETGRDYFPIRHALGMLVPGLNLYIAYVHLKAIRELLVASGMETTLSPVRGVIIMGAFLVAQLPQLQTLFQTGTISRGDALLMDLLGIAVTAYIMMWGQSALNRYWVQKYGDRLVEAPIARGEVLIVLIGAMRWSGYLWG